MAEWPYNTAAWKRLRLVKLATNPLCYACELRGLTVPAVAVDHVKAITSGGDPFPPLDGLMSLLASGGMRRRHLAEAEGIVANHRKLLRPSTRRSN